MYDYEKTTRSPFHNDNRKSTLVTRADWRILSDRSFVGRKNGNGLDFKIRKKAFSRKSGILSIFVRAGRSFAGRLISKNVEKTDFDPNAPGVNNGRYFGLPFTPEQARLVLMSVPWDVTTSYREGRPAVPDAILDASLQVDLYDLHNPDGWRQGIGTLPVGDTLELRGKNCGKRLGG